MHGFYWKIYFQSYSCHLSSWRSEVLKYSWTWAMKTFPATSQTATNSPLADTVMLVNTSRTSEPWPYGNNEYRLTTPICFPLPTEYAAVRMLKKSLSFQLMTYYQHHSTVFLQNLLVIHLIKKFPILKPICSLPSSEKFIIWNLGHTFTPHSCTIHYSPTYSYMSQMGPFFVVSQPKFCMHLLLLHAWYISHKSHPASFNHPNNMRIKNY